MKIKKGFMLRSVGGRHVVVAIGKASEEFNGLIKLNETGAFLWKQLEKGTTYDDMLSALLNEYEVDEATARQGIDAFIETAKNANLIED